MRGPQISTTPTLRYTCLSTLNKLLAKSNTRVKHQNLLFLLQACPHHLLMLHRLRGAGDGRPAAPQLAHPAHCQCRRPPSPGLQCLQSHWMRRAAATQDSPRPWRLSRDTRSRDHHPSLPSRGICFGGSVGSEMAWEWRTQENSQGHSQGTETSTCSQKKEAHLYLPEITCFK